MVDIVSDKELQLLTEQVAQCLGDNNWRLSVAESCTGGWVGKCCTDIAGSSTWFDRGFITYSNEAKQDLLHVKELTLSQYGAVSEQTANEMVQGVLSESLADISVAITGIAGPDGGTIDKPVGTVWFGWATKKSTVQTQCYHLEGNRESIRRQAVKIALQGIMKNARD